MVVIHVWDRDEQSKTWNYIDIGGMRGMVKRTNTVFRFKRSSEELRTALG